MGPSIISYPIRNRINVGNNRTLGRSIDQSTIGTTERPRTSETDLLASNSVCESFAPMVPMDQNLQATPRRRKMPRRATPSPSPSTNSLTPRLSPSPIPSTEALSGSLSRGRVPSSDLLSASPDVSPGDGARQVPSRWAKVKTQVRVESIKESTEEIFGYAPRPWQLRAMNKIREGHDVMTVAGTGAGKSLVFALVAIAAALGGFDGLVLVICPLKALQNDQVC